MTDTTTPLSVDDAIAQVQAVLTQLQTQAAVAPATVLPDGTPGPVAAGELIESAWGNAVVNTLKRSVGCSYWQSNQAFTAGLTAQVVWPVRNYDTASPSMNAPGGNTFTVPLDMAGSWSITATMLSQPGAPTATCTLTLNTNPALQLQPAAVILAGQTLGTLTWTGSLQGGHQFSFNFYNAHPGGLNLAVQMEARWLGF